MLRNEALFLLTSIVVVAPKALSAQGAVQSPAEQQIRALEQTQVDLLLHNDVAGMQRNWSKDYVVNNPFNQVVDASAGPIRRGQLTYSSFVRDIERMLVHDHTVVVMGSETVVPSGQSPDAGKTIHRRFTDVWMNEGGQWLLIARHASVICGDNSH
ncbi:MAG TPA: nuclear transport factor 2 family protein [Nitrospirales bacterium]|jgi:hypothetical protein|nr:nuclear transport factor 2 family protein [Nitrospirales bacterium]